MAKLVSIAQLTPIKSFYWVPLPDILALRIAQYNARIFELRGLGHPIESKQEGDRSWFRLISQAPTIAADSPSIQEMATKAESLFHHASPTS